MTRDPAARSRSSSRGCDRQPHILIVDDEPDACANLSDILLELDYRVDTAGDGFEALELASRTTYDVALLDFKMPHMDGLTLFHRLKQLSPGTAAVIVTAYGVEARLPTLGGGIDAVCYKPVDMEDLLSTVYQLSRRTGHEHRSGTPDT